MSASAAAGTEVPDIVSNLLNDHLHHKQQQVATMLEDVREANVVSDDEGDAGEDDSGQDTGDAEALAQQLE